MKKIFTTIALMALTLGASAQTSWDFSSTPEADKTNLAADANWEYVEKSDRYQNTKDYTPAGEELKANNQVLALTKGLLIDVKGRNGGARVDVGKVFILWGNAQADLTLTIPNLKKGQVVEVKARPAKTTGDDHDCGLTATNITSEKYTLEETEYDSFAGTFTGTVTHKGTVTHAGDVVLSATGYGIAFVSIAVTGEGEEEATYGITVDPTTNGTVTPDKTSAAAGETVKLTISSAAGYELNTLKVYYETTIPVTQSDGAGISSARARALGVSDWQEVEVNDDNTFTMPDGPVVIVATFKEQGTTPAETRTLTVGKEWVTFCSPVTFAVPTGLKAYTVTAVTAPKTGITGEIEVKEEGYIVAGQPMLIENTVVGTTTEFEVSLETGNVSLTNTPCTEYKGSASSQQIAEGTYILYNGTFLRTNGGTLAACNCYLDLKGSSAQGARRFSIVGGGIDTTAIQTIGAATLSDGEWYTLGGIRTGKPTQKGVYIKNGRKYIVK